MDLFTDGQGVPCQQTGVDQVDAFRLVQLFCFVIPDDEFQVLAYPVWLNKTDVVADDVGFGEFR